MSSPLTNRSEPKSLFLIQQPAFADESTFAGRSSQICSLNPSNQRNAANLFSKAKLAENRVEQIFRRRLANDFTDGVDGDAQIQRDQFE